MRRRYLKEDTILQSNGYTKIDNFKEFEAFITPNKPEEIWFVQIMRRKKDHENDPNDNWNYHQGYAVLDTKIIHSADELKSLKPEIINACETNGARAYIFLNRRNIETAKEYIKVGESNGWFDRGGKFYHHRNHKLAFALGQKKMFQSRPICFLDVDKNDPKTFAIVEEVLKSAGITPLMKYRTASLGMHYILPDKEVVIAKKIADILNQKLDKGRDYGRWATSGIHYDCPNILYLNLMPNNYQREERKVKELEQLYDTREKMIQRGQDTRWIDKQIYNLCGAYPKK